MKESSKKAQKKENLRDNK